MVPGALLFYCPGTTGTFAMSVFAVPALNANCFSPLPQGYYGTPYYSDCSVNRGSSPRTVTVSAGQLPPGLTVEPTGGNITGTPTATGTYPFTLHFSDKSVPPHTTDASSSITISPRQPETAPVTITATSGGIVTSTTVMVTVP